MTGHPIAISNEAMAILIDLARPLDPRDRTKFIESVVADLNGHAPGHVRTDLCSRQLPAPAPADRRAQEKNPRA